MHALSDTFTWMVPEILSLGVPVITIDIPTLPRFTESDSNWALTVKSNDGGIWLWRHSDPVFHDT